MKKSILPLAILATAAFSFNSAHAQIAKQKGITIEEVSKQINEVVSKGGNEDEKKARLLKEADALAAAKNEDFNMFASKIYEFISQEDKAKATDKLILKRFPKGKKARQEAYAKIFDNTELTAEAAEKQYNDWQKKFPATSSDQKDQGIYTNGLTKIALLYIKENKQDKAKEYLAKLQSSQDAVQAGYTIGSELAKSDNYETAFPLLETAYNQSLEATKSSEKSVKNSNAARYYSAIAPLYAKALAKNGNTEKSTSILESLLTEDSWVVSEPDFNILLAQNYAKLGKELDAFLMLEKFILKNGKNETMIKELTPLYNKLNNNKSDVNNYIATLDIQAKEALYTKYKAEMIKKEAPQFSLVDREGKTVSLADYKGKVVILDFWATWCGPCKISFPGMQAAVNKYQDDKDVAFLFIDTWQREENYKEVVNEFITKNNYTFHVLFDEMKDRSKSITTAYEVKGIPHKVVIDKEGFIRFEASGGTADVEKIVNEMDIKIELAKQG